MQDDERLRHGQGVTWKSIAITLVLIPSRGEVARGPVFRDVTTIRTRRGA